MNDLDETNPRTAGHSQNQTASAAISDIPEYTTRELFGARNELLIRHNGEQYRLRITRQAKLILTK